MATSISGFLDGTVYRDFSPLTEPPIDPSEALKAEDSTETDNECSTETDADCSTETDVDCPKEDGEVGSTETDADCETRKAAPLPGSPVQGWQDPPRFH